MSERRRIFGGDNKRSDGALLVMRMASHRQRMQRTAGQATLGSNGGSLSLSRLHCHCSIDNADSSSSSWQSTEETEVSPVVMKQKIDKQIRCSD